MGVVRSNKNKLGGFHDGSFAQPLQSRVEEARDDWIDNFRMC